MTALIQQLSFDYTVLDKPTEAAVILHRDAIKNLMRRTAQDIWDIGQHLTEAKNWLDHGQFIDWLEKEFSMNERTARNFMSVFKTFKTAKFSDFNVATSALYLMASPSTPEEVRADLIDRAAAGETITHATAKQVIAATKPSIEDGSVVDSSADPPDDEPEETHAEFEIGNRVNHKSYPDGSLGTVTKIENGKAFVQFEGEKSPVPYRLENLIPAPAELTPRTIEPSALADATPGDLVVGYYANGDRFEVGELLTFGDGFATLLNSNDQRVNVDLESLRWPTSAEKFAYTDDDSNAFLNNVKRDNSNILSSQKTDSHYTPDWLWKPALEVIGADKFALDPASNSHHSPNVPAETVYTIEDDGLVHPWDGNSIWINPPFSRMDEFVLKATLEAKGHLFFLAKCDCRPAWFQALCDMCCAFVMIHKSVKFLGNDNSSFFGVAIFYRGPDPNKFYHTYSRLGTVCMPVIPGLLGE